MRVSAGADVGGLSSVGRSHHSRTRVRALVATAAVALVLQACSPGSAGPPPPRSQVRRPGHLTDAQALRASQMLYRNHLLGGATLQVSALYPPDLSVTLRGAVDWSDRAVRLVVTTSRPGSAPRSQLVVVVGATVFTNESATAADAGRWSSRPIAVAARPLDRLCRLVLALAAVKPDNPTLLQEGDLRFDRHEVVRGMDADVFSVARKGMSYWVSRKGGRLLRVRGTLPGFAGPAVIDLLHPRAEHIVAPSAAPQRPR